MKFDTPAKMYRGVIMSYNERTKKHEVLFDDSTVEHIKLKVLIELEEVKWVLSS
jgi:hypothetical protein